MRLVPGYLLQTAAIGFFVAAYFDRTATFIAIGVVFQIVAGMSFMRARAGNAH